MAHAFTDSTKTFYSNKNIFFVVALSATYLALSYLLIGFRPEQAFLVLLFAVLYFASGISRKFIIAFSVFIIYWIIFDWMKAFPNYRYSQVHISDLYLAEKKLFGISYLGNKITPNEYWLRNGNTFLDVLAGIFYLTWVPVPLLFAVYLFFKKREQFFYFSLTFFMVNIIGFVIYYAFPAAPPWYVQQHGFVFHAATPGSTAGLSKFDHFFKAGVFSAIYAKSSNVFAAMPSLHSSYPVIVMYYGLKNKLGPVNILFAAIMPGIWFSAVYASHHYVLDVLVGIACAITGISLFRLLAQYSKAVQNLISKLVALTS
ncbi:MAG: inositol phosphorylceramide synthase [Bacteroidetes bacterium]|nr:inositol phosphorylceramide synthase [Bacteroidota bacterium]MBS1972821.1 inositol phosphorylceramide synthase [Bacteroidota bacterium]